jgi:hypothetical protein
MTRRPLYLFSINTGRSGSEYLARIFKQVEGCCAFHEPKPICNAREMRLYLQGETKPMEVLSKKKAKLSPILRVAALYISSQIIVS